MTNSCIFILDFCDLILNKNNTLFFIAQLLLIFWFQISGYMMWISPGEEKSI